MNEPAPSIPGLYELVSVDVTDSGRAHAERLAAEGAAEGTIVWTRSQREGLGRKGRYWMSGNRNLHCAIILRPDQALASCCQLSLVTTISVMMAMSRQAEPLEEFRFRWPNDVLLNQGKIAGVTLSGELNGSSVEWMVVGVNVNVYDQPHSKGFEAASMRGEGFETYDRVRLLEDFSREFLSWINRWNDEGFETVRRAWLFKGYGKGDPVRVSLGDSLISGQFDDMLPDGSIAVRSGSGLKTLGLTEFFQSDFEPAR